MSGHVPKGTVVFIVQKASCLWREAFFLECPLPPEARHLAWLSLDSQEGQEYWAAMNLAGDYASACHHDIHRRLSKALGEKPLAQVENHHNFAWKETLADGRTAIVHRKGATPAGQGVLGIIPGSMTAPGFIVRGRGEPDSINSASHGAGRRLSRTQAKAKITEGELRRELRDHGVELMGGGLDEAPAAYKDIRQVMAARLRPKSCGWMGRRKQALLCISNAFGVPA